MSLLDAFELLDLLELVRSWRFTLATAIGVAIGLLVYYGIEHNRAAAAAGVIIGVGFTIGGIVWQSDHNRRNR